MKTVICKTNGISSVSDASGHALHTHLNKVPQKGKEYRVTGELTFDGVIYYLLMGFGIKTAFRSDKFQDCL